jgi:hypothetical protein
MKKGWENRSALSLWVQPQSAILTNVWECTEIFLGNVYRSSWARRNGQLVTQYKEMYERCIWTGTIRGS